MTATQAAHLIEQFAAQCPLAIWILDSRGVAIFANPKLHEIFDIPSSPSGAVGMNVLKLSCVERLRLTDKRDRLMDGEPVSLTVNIEHPDQLDDELPIGRKDPILVRTVAYALKSSAQTIEHYVIFIEDVTETHSHHELLKEQTHDIQTFLQSKETRGEKLQILKAQADELRKLIREAGDEPNI